MKTYQNLESAEKQHEDVYSNKQPVVNRLQDDPINGPHHLTFTPVCSPLPHVTKTGLVINRV